MFHDEFTISFTQGSVHDRNPHVPRPVSHDNKQLLDEVFVISGLIKVGVSVISRSRNTYLDLDYSGYHKNRI